MLLPEAPSAFICGVFSPVLVLPTEEIDDKILLHELLHRRSMDALQSIFWSFAYRDWVADDQPGAQAAYDTVMSNYHNGCIMLLHAVSESNTEALDSILKDIKAAGYSFESLENLP